MLVKVCLFTICGGLDSSRASKKKLDQEFNAPHVLCFACPRLLVYFREASNLCCAHEASPYFLLEGGRVCLILQPKILLPGNV